MGRRAAQSPRLPSGFWARPDVVDALRSRDLGAVFRLISRWGGTSQTQIAIAVGMTQGQVSGFMGGKRRVSSMEVAERTLSGLDAPADAWVAFGLAAPQHATARDRVPSIQRTRLDAAPGEASDVDRRKVLRLGGAAVTAAFPPVRLAAALLLPQVIVGDAGPATVADLTTEVTSAWRLRQCADYEELRALLPTLIEKAEVSASILHGGERERAVRLLVHTYNAASSLLRRLGDESLAMLAADRAVRTARGLGDPVLTAAAKYRLANVLLTAHRTADAKAVALDAADLTEPGKVQTPRSIAVWGGLLLTAAVAAARGGEETEAWELLGEARTGGRLQGADYSDIYSIFGPTNVAIHGVQIAVELGDGRDAARRSRDVDPDRLPASLVERQAQFRIDVAQSQALQGEDGASVASLLCAEQVAPQEIQLSPEVRQLTRTLLGRERVSATPGLRGLASRLGIVG